MKQRVLVCGGRDYSNWDDLAKVLDTTHYINPVELLIAGGAPGADTLAVGWANSRLIPVKVFKADWRTYGKAAGPLRNQQMVDDGKPHIVIAFPGGDGTADMIRRAEAAKIPVKRITI